MDYQDKLIDKFAKSETDKICRSVIRSLQHYKDSLLSGEDTELNNAWDEICVQVQDEYSFYWDAYVIMAMQHLVHCIDKLPEHVNQAIFFQTEMSDELLDDPAFDGMDLIGDSSDIAEYIFREHLMPMAMEWSNPAIREYLERSGRRD